MTEKKLIALLETMQISRDWHYHDVCSALRVNGCDVHSFEVSDGASKLCIIFKNLPFVVKWSYGDFNEDEAVKEVAIYESAKKQGLDFFFPRTEILTICNGVAFVKQEKITCSACDVSDLYTRLENIGKTATERIVCKMERQFHKTHGYHRHLSRLWAKAAISLYGKKKCKALCQFIIDHDINDLHENNLGFKGLQPIVLDFSGYHRESY